MKAAVIPARGGSRRIPNKNIREFRGKPIIAWSIEAALESGCFERVLVSTDDRRIAEVAGEWGAETPFMRPAALADDQTGTSPVVAHAIEWLRGGGSSPDSVCCIYATAPFITASDLRRGLEALEETGAEVAFSVTRYEYPIQRALRINAGGRLEMFSPGNFEKRSQDLEDAYHDAGQFYWARAAAWCSGKALFSHDALPVILPHHRVQDIDTEEDWQHAERMFAILDDHP